MPRGVYKRKKPAWNKGMKGFVTSSTFKKGHQWSEEIEAKLKIIRTGKRHTEEWKRWLSERNKKLGVRIPVMRGKDHYAWKGGLTLGENGKIYRRNKIRKRRLHLKTLPGSHTHQEWEELKAKHDHRCVSCLGQEPFTDQVYSALTEDHIIPLSKGGSNDISNIAPMCHRCNSRKGAKLISFIDDRKVA